jgi:protein required for attachment to host cells
MRQDERTLVVTADGVQARVFEEARRGGHLIEHTDWLEDLHSKSGRDSAVRGTHGRHGESGADKAEAAFLGKLCDRLNALMTAESFDALILIAPPRALGVLREKMAKGLHQRLALDEAHDRVDATAEALTKIIRDLRQAKA